MTTHKNSTWPDEARYVLVDLKTPVSGVYKTAECEDVPKKTSAVQLFCYCRESVQVCVCDDGSVWVRKTDFANYWNDWDPVEPKPDEDTIPLREENRALSLCLCGRKPAGMFAFNVTDGYSDPPKYWVECDCGRTTLNYTAIPDSVEAWNRLVAETARKQDRERDAGIAEIEEIIDSAGSDWGAAVRIYDWWVKTRGIE